MARWLEELRVDVAAACRQMKASPGFTMVAALTLALGIGANGAIFALADATFLRPLPFTTSQDRLVMVWERFPNGFRTQTTPHDYVDWADQNQSFDAMAAIVMNSVSVGVFGVLAYSVQQRVREFGVRIAIGAATSDVMRLVLGSAAKLMAIGLAVGLGAAAALTRYLTTLLYAVTPLDPITFAAVPIVLLISAAIAVAAPTWRAARVDPVVAFRAE
jgi:ABC-type antimicrobial peptide transport system permease subunit